MAADGSDCGQLLPVTPPFIYTQLQKHCIPHVSFRLLCTFIIQQHKVLGQRFNHTKIVTFFCFLPSSRSSRLMWLNSRRRTPRGPFTLIVRPFSVTSTAVIRTKNYKISIFRNNSSVGFILNERF